MYATAMENSTTQSKRKFRNRITKERMKNDCVSQTNREQVIRNRFIAVTKSLQSVHIQGLTTTLLSRHRKNDRLTLVALQLLLQLLDLLLLRGQRIEQLRLAPFIVDLLLVTHHQCTDSRLVARLQVRYSGFREEVLVAGGRRPLEHFARNTSFQFLFTLTRIPQLALVMIFNSASPPDTRPSSP